MSFFSTSVAIVPFGAQVSLHSLANEFLLQESAFVI
jgi:hypothetical protein